MPGVDGQRQTPAERLAAKKVADARRIRRSAAKAAKPKPTRDPMVVRCGTCGGMTRRITLDSNLFAAHKQPRGRWCEAGAAPTASDRTSRPSKRGKVKRSVWAASGGLPTLGKSR